jgi:hypothetical protein
MKRKIKPILTIVLLTFAGVTLAVQIAKEFRSVEPIRLAEGLNVICTHATVRCPTCLTMKRLTKETLDESFKDSAIVFREVNYELPEASALADEFKIATATVVLVNVQEGKIVAGKNLVNESWKLYTDEPAFKQMLKEQIKAMMQGKILDIEIESQEIIFGDEDNSIELPF